jgi:toxin YoeB
MEVYFNELSVCPKSNTIIEAQNNVTILLTALNELRKHDIRVMRTHDNFFAEELSDGYTFSDFVIDNDVSRDLRILLQSIAKSPFLKKDSEEEESFILTTFKSESHIGEKVAVEGIASAYLNNSPTVSIPSCDAWRKDSLDLFVESTIGTSYNTSVTNFWNEESVLNWLLSIIETLPLNTIDNIKRVFSEDKFKFDQQAIDELIAWYYDDERYQNKIRDLIFDIPSHPFVGGIGFTEVLRDEGGKASKRIVKKDRIVYTYSTDLIIIHQCEGHYKDK